MLFRDKQRLLSLYNAVNHSDYNNPDELQVVTLENAIYMNMKNDIAFLIHDELHLYEHQSTVNPNMPLRNLFYVAREYQKLVDSRTLYGGKLSLIPAPHFLVFYNGEKNQPQQRRMKLSESYLTGEEEPELELTVTVLNINSGNNDFLREKCQSLNEYMLYIESVRSYIKKGMDLEDAVDLAVNECIEQGILAEFLRKHRAEAMEMGAAAVMANTAIATAGDIPAMAYAFKNAIEAGRAAHLAGLGRVLERGASASDPLTGFLRD